jgi:hypothetical protein
MDYDNKIKKILNTFITKEFRKPESQFEERLLQSYVKQLFELLWQYNKSDIADSNFEKVILTGYPQKIRSSVWEAQLWKYLIEQDFNLSSKDEGPDFFFETRGQRIWIEATANLPMEVPELEEISKNVFAYPEKLIPNDPFLLRWTNAIDTKTEKFKKYIESNKIHIKDSDICIIAISSINMEKHFSFNFRPGSEDPPYALQAVYGIGKPYYDSKNNIISYSQQNNIIKKNKSCVPTNVFFNPEYKHISAVLAANTSTCSSNNPTYILIHNVSAKNKVPKNLFNIDEEWIASRIDNSDTYIIKKI